MLPALQKDDPTWHELRAMGVGWWLRSSSRLRRCMEKVRLHPLSPSYLALCLGSPFTHVGTPTNPWS